MNSHAPLSISVFHRRSAKFLKVLFSTLDKPFQ